jgi:SPX domain protein involved in polyphosphate accumulation
MLLHSVYTSPPFCNALNKVDIKLQLWQTSNLPSNSPLHACYAPLLAFSHSNAPYCGLLFAGWVRELESSGILVQVPCFSKFLHGMAYSLQCPRSLSAGWVQELE